ncbi:hypothetical protein NKR23_g1372 [Pleurostoma richardsiae]|uniref:DUF7708 domain-containing protein n=1 Tax=Pleurostoma richardsiae TaxID=41990 RepID=A0AA38VZE7_9PEZI|nr:hypothetical protein NKR23_g1372 [Pleurostoma richardsiae]
MEVDERQEFLMSRARPPTSEAAVFVENRIAVPGQPPAVYVENLDRFTSIEEGKRQEQISVELWKLADAQKSELFTAMEQVRTKLDKRSPGGVQDSRRDFRHCTWDQVMEEVQSLSARWSTTPKRTSKAMVCLQKLGRSSDAFRSWLQLLPAGDYGSSICGVFTLVIGAAGQYAKIEDSILESLAEIPEIMESARKYIRIYSRLRDTTLERRTFELYLSILRTLTYIMLFIAESSFRKVLQSTLQQSSYKSEIVASVKDIRIRAERIKEEANQCMQRRLMDMDQTLLIQSNVLHGLDQKSDQSLHILQNMYRFLENSVQLLMSGQASEAVDHPVRKLEASSQRRIERAAVADVDQRVERAKELLQLLSFDPDVVRQDIETCSRLGDAMDGSSKAKAAALIGNRRFKAYLTENASSAPLLVNGNEDLSCAEGLSPLSLVAARLAQISEQTGAMYVLKYFCGQHPPYIGDPVASSPTGLMASLVGQLITQMMHHNVEVDLSFLTRADLAHVKRLKPAVLYLIFQELTSQLPPRSVLLCILDEVALYETGAQGNDMKSVLKKLTRLVRKSEDIVFKLLVTCRGRALNAGIFAEHILDLDESVEAQDSSSWQIANMVI